jgi:hypothetical protein
VLDPVSGPKWRLDCNRCSFLVYLPQGLHAAAVLPRQRCLVGAVWLDGGRCVVGWCARVVGWWALCGWMVGTEVGRVNLVQCRRHTRRPPVCCALPQECGASLLSLDWRKGHSPLGAADAAAGAAAVPTNRIGCIACDALLSSLCEVGGSL